VPNENGKTLVGVINEAKEELKEFLDTRLQMLVSEMKQKLSVWKLALPSFVVAGIIGFVGFILLSVALVAAIATAIGWGWSFLVVGAFYCLVAGGIGLLAYAEIKAEGVAPERTLRVLKQDKVWLQNEARTQL
jgi:Putative Actinobacterial Holin-X, holin superfamily III